MVCRCSWVGNDPAMIKYHDQEWGVPCRDDLKLFEYVVLDTFQAGLSWSLMIKKRENFRVAFDGFDPVKIAGYSQVKIEQLLANPGIIRNRLKIHGTVKNAQAFLRVQGEFGSFAYYIWSFVKDQTIDHGYRHGSHIGTTSEESDRMSQDMKRRGFAFCGSTVCYAFMQGAGLINDHTTDCFRYNQLHEQPRLEKTTL